MRTLIGYIALYFGAALPLECLVGSYLRMKGLRDGSGGVTVWMAMDRKQLCERIVTGKRTIPAQPEREIEEVEWRCADAILMN